MGDTTLEQLADRMSKLERRLRWWKAAVAVAMLSIIGLAWFVPLSRGNLVPEVVKAQEFDVVGSDGKIVAIFGANITGTSGMIRLGYSLAANSEQPALSKTEMTPDGLYLMDQNGKAFSSLTSANSEGTLVGRLSVGDLFTSFASVSRAAFIGEGSDITQVFGGAILSKSLAANDSVSVGVGLGGPWVNIDNSSVSILDNLAKPRAVLGVTGIVNPQTGATTTTAPSSLYLFDKDGKVLWRDPYP